MKSITQATENRFSTFLKNVAFKPLVENNKIKVKIVVSHAHFIAHVPKLFYKPPIAESSLMVFHVGLCSLSLYGKTIDKSIKCSKTFEDFDLKDGWVEIKWADGTHVG